jgi:hypothetical protein
MYFYSDNNKNILNWQKLIVIENAILLQLLLKCWKF